MTATDDTYNGWPNRETWACNLYITNDRGLYESATLALSEAARARSGYTRSAGQVLQDWWDELADPDSRLMNYPDILSMVRDIGSEYRIDWAAIASELMEDDPK